MPQVVPIRYLFLSLLYFIVTPATFFKNFFKKGLIFLFEHGIIHKLSGTKVGNFRVWRSLVSRLNGVQEAAGSNPVTRTIKVIGFSLKRLNPITFFFVFSRVIRISFRQPDRQLYRFA